MKTKLIIKKEIPVDFSVKVGKYLYSFNLMEEIFHSCEIGADGKLQEYWGRFEPMKIQNETILEFSCQDGQWIAAKDEIQQAYKDYIAERELL